MGGCRYTNYLLQLEKKTRRCHTTQKGQDGKQTSEGGWEFTKKCFASQFSFTSVLDFSQYRLPALGQWIVGCRFFKCNSADTLEQTDCRLQGCKEAQCRVSPEDKSKPMNCRFVVSKKLRAGTTRTAAGSPVDESLVNSLQKGVATGGTGSREQDSKRSHKTLSCSRL